MTEKNKSKGKVALPFLLSTTKSLLKSKRFYYNGLDYRFICKRNRDCYTERNVRINMTRQFHNVIIPNAILCRESGFKPTFQDALDALNHAMVNGKTERSLATWMQICRDEAALPKEQQVVYKYRRSFYYYVLGQAATKDGLLYALPKSKVITLNAYTQKLSKFICKSLPKKCCWYSPWNGLNLLVYKWKHWNDEFDKRCDDRQKRIDKLEEQKGRIFGWDEFAAKKRAEIDAELKLIDAEYENDSPPDFPNTLRAICDEFDVSMTTAQQFKLWLAQYRKYNSDEYDGEEYRKVYWPEPKSTDGKDKDNHKDIIDLTNIESTQGEDTVDDDTDETDPTPEDTIEHDIQAAVNSGNRPEGRWDTDGGDDGLEPLPF